MGGSLCPQASLPSAGEEDMTAVRRSVPNDHSCLFWAVAYLAEPVSDVGRAKARELREVCAKEALDDPDPGTKALLLGFDSIEEYSTWIRNEFHWGGENEILALAKHYGVEVAVVTCEALKVLCYGSDLPNCKDRIYLLYTGQHYDPIVSGPDSDVTVENERKRQRKGDSTLDSSALDLARKQNEEAARKAKQRRAKKIKCGGCGALLSDAEAFATHCSEVEHDDDFCYDCEEVEVVIEGDEDLPEGTIDLNSDSVYTFSNTGKDELCNAFPAPVTIGGVSFPTLEHYWQAAPFIGVDDSIVQNIAATKTVDEAMIAAGGAGPHAQRSDWREARSSLLLEGVRAKAAQSPSFVNALIATSDKTVVCLDADPWGGMQAPGGIPTGQNNVGKVLMEVRTDLRAKA